MSLLYDSILPFCETDKNCIFLCDDQAILKFKTFKEVISLSQLIQEQLSKYFTKSHECIGVLMNHNIYLPSIVIRYVFWVEVFFFIEVLVCSNLVKVLHLLAIKNLPIHLIVCNLIGLYHLVKSKTLALKSVWKFRLMMLC